MTYIKKLDARGAVLIDHTRESTKHHHLGPNHARLQTHTRTPQIITVQQTVRGPTQPQLHTVISQMPLQRRHVTCVGTIIHAQERTECEQRGAGTGPGTVIFFQ